MVGEGIKVLLNEKRVFKPSKKLVENSNVMKWMKEHNIKSYDDLLKKAKNLEWFWGEISKEMVEWYKPPKKVLDWKLPYVKWFSGAKYNIVHDALDKHAKSKKTRNKIAYIFEGEPGDVDKITYADLYKRVNKFANALKKMGVKKGDRVAIYLPMIPQLPIAMLACAKIGAVHAVVFSGFSSMALRMRIKECGAKVLITCNGYWRKGKIVNLKAQADEALEDAPSIKKSIVYKRVKGKTKWNKKIDVWWHEAIKGKSDKCKTEVMDANDTLFLLYTSGSTGHPKGCIHAHGGYAVGTATTLKWVFDLKQYDVWWCAADIGWITGHSYIVYGPLILGSTSIMYEGHPLHPGPDRWWKMVKKYKVSVFYTSPTAVRMFLRLGKEWPAKHDLSSLRLLGSVGEPINPEVWMWYYKNIGKSKCPIMDTWWQTEDGMFCIAPLPITPLKPGSATKPFPGVSAAVYNDSGKKVTRKGGHLVLLNPWPAMFRGVYKNPKRYLRTYWAKFPGVFLAGDVARIDKDGYFWIQGREDDVLKVAGHRLSNSEIESSLVTHKAVSEAAVIGKPHKIKGAEVVALVLLKRGFKDSEELRVELRKHVSKQIGKIARPSEVWFVDDLPKTRSGKIMRRVIKAKLIGGELGDLSTLMNPEAVEGLDDRR